MLAVIEDHLEHPAGIVELGLGQQGGPAACIVQQRHTVAIADALDVAVGLAAGVVFVTSVALVGMSQINAGAVLGRILVDNGIALIVASFADQPGEDMLGAAGSAMREPASLP